MSSYCYPVHFRACGPILTDDFGTATLVGGRMLVEIGANERTEIRTVNPAGIYLAASNLKAALAAAVEQLGRGLTVLAEDSSDFAEFEERSRRLVEREIPSLEKEWDDARSAAAALPDRDEFLQLIEPPPIEIANKLLYEGAQLTVGSPRLVISGLQLERAAA